MNWYQEENLNSVERVHFESAIKLAAHCIPEDDRLKPKVGCVIIKDGEIVASSYRNQTGRGDHAEFIALEHSGLAKADFNEADLITTLEPCTTRSHGSVKKPCVDWILLRNIRKVWIGTLDYNPNITGRSIIKLQDNGIKIGWFPDDLKIQIIQQNRDFFNHILQSQPRISRLELKNRLEEIKTYAQEELARLSNLIVNDNETALKAKNRGHFLLLSAISHMLLMDVEKFDDWTHLGLRFKLAQESDDLLSKQKDLLSIWNGLPPLVLSGMSYLAASKIDASKPEAWIGLAKAQLGINTAAQAFATLNNSRKFLDGPNAEYALLYHDITKQILALQPSPILLEMCTWSVFGSLQQGIHIHDIVETIKQLVSFKPNVYSDIAVINLRRIAKIVRESNTVFGLADEIELLVKTIMKQNNE